MSKLIYVICTFILKLDFFFFFFSQHVLMI